MKKISNILWGLVFVGVGLIVGLNTLNITNINIFFNGWWTLFIIVPCFIDLFNEGSKTGNIVGIIIGLLFLLSANNIIDFSVVLKLIIPIGLVVIGLSMIFRDKVEKKVKEKIKELNKKNNKEYCATFGGQDLDFTNEEFEGCDLTAVFGGIECNLSEAKITNDVVINTSAIFGGVTIIAPKDIAVKVKSTSIFGGVENKHRKNIKDASVTIYVNATCLFGGVDIK